MRKYIVTLKEWDRPEVSWEVHTTNDELTLRQNMKALHPNWQSLTVKEIQ